MLTTSIRPVRPAWRSVPSLGGAGFQTAFALALASTPFQVTGQTPQSVKEFAASNPADPFRALGTKILARPNGTIAYSDTGGSGPLVICVPGMGDLRSTWRWTLPLLAGRGYRVICMDLRGQGESSTAFKSYAAEDVGSDILALVESLQAGPAVIVGNSMAGAASIWAAAERPQAVAGLVLEDPFIRDFPISFLKRTVMKLAFLRPWGATVWVRYYDTLYIENRPPDQKAHLAAIKENLGEAGRLDALKRMVWSSKSVCEGRAEQVRVPALVIMGTKDPDFPDPAAEAREVAHRLKGQVLLVEGAGHYPHSERPEIVAAAIERFIQGLNAPTSDS